MLAAISSAFLSASKHLSHRPPWLDTAAYLHPDVRHLAGVVAGKVVGRVVTKALEACGVADVVVVTTFSREEICLAAA